MGALVQEEVKHFLNQHSTPSYSAKKSNEYINMRFRVTLVKLVRPKNNPIENLWIILQMKVYISGTFDENLNAV